MTDIISETWIIMEKAQIHTRSIMSLEMAAISLIVVWVRPLALHH